MGLLAAPLLLAPTLATLLGATEHGSIWWAPGGALIFVWELSVGLYMTFKGFKPSPLTAHPTAVLKPSGGGPPSTIERCHAATW